MFEDWDNTALNTLISLILRHKPETIGITEGKDKSEGGRLVQLNLTKNGMICKLRLIDRRSLLYYNSEKC